MLHYKEISYQENIDDLKDLKNEILNVKILEIKDDKIRFFKELLKDPLIGLKITKRNRRCNNN